MYQSRSRSEENGKQETKLKFIVEREGEAVQLCVIELSNFCNNYKVNLLEKFPWQGVRYNQSILYYTTNIHDSALLEIFYMTVVYFPCISPVLFTILVETSLQTNHQYLQIWGVPE